MNTVPEISMYGDSADWLVNEGVKLLTLRLDRPKYDNLLVGKNIIIHFENDFGSGVVFDRQIKPLASYSLGELLLDGYVNHHEALQDLKQYPGYENMTLNTPLLGLGITTTSRFGAYLNKTERELLCNTPLDQAIRMPNFHRIFLPSYLWWTLLKCEESKTKFSIDLWHGLLGEQLRICDSEQLANIRMTSKQTKRFYDGLSLNKVRDILKHSSTNSPEYRSVVLCQTIDVN